MRLGRNVTDKLWTPYSSQYITSISVIEHPEKKKDEEEPTETVPKVAFGFARALEES